MYFFNDLLREFMQNNLQIWKCLCKTFLSCWKWI